MPPNTPFSHWASGEQKDVPRDPRGPQRECEHDIAHPGDSTYPIDPSFHRFAESLPALVWSSRSDGVCDYYNRRFLDYLGKTLDEMRGRTWSESLYPEDAGRSHRAWEAARTRGTEYQIEYRIRRHDGQYRSHWGHIAPIQDVAGRITRWVGTCTDIDDPRRAEEAMQDVEARFRALYHQPAIGIAEIDLSGRILGANSRYREIVGYPREELLGLRLQEITHPDDRPGILERFARIAREPSSCTFESRCVRKDACVVWVRATLSPITEVSGRPARVLALVEVVTGRVRLEAQLRRMLDELDDPDGRTGEFMAILAFQLRSSLTPLHYVLQAMKLTSADPATLQEARALLELVVEQMVRLVNNLGDVDRLRRGLVALRKEPVALATIVRQAVEISCPLIEAHGHELTIDLPPGSIPLDADAHRLTQVFSNLLDNAARYTSRAGRIRLTAERRGDSVIVAVQDTGIGIPAHVLPHVFHAFTRIGRSSGWPIGGLGIGLWLVKGLVELHGGSVEAHSAGHDRGSEFVVRLPVAAQSRDGDAGEAAAATGRRRVLVVDDSYEAADSLAKLLGLLGHETQAAHSGLEALEVGGVFRPDAILMDIGMPGLDGHETARRIRKEAWGEDVVLVAMTGWGRDEDRLRTREAGFDFHLVKPIDPSVVKEILDGMRPRRYPGQGSAEALSR